MSKYKIIFAGPVGAGKTTAIGAISDIPVVSTESNASDMTKNRKKETTVAMDYGAHLPEGHSKIHLYGTPGQERFKFMWDILTQGGLGLILLIDNTRADPFKDLHFYLDAFKDFLVDKKLVVGVTRGYLPSGPSIVEYQKELANRGMNSPVFGVDARRRDEVSTLVKAFLAS